jgi:ADP-ribose pyrophosphatase YjhB (NUDIX family)
MSDYTDLPDEDEFGNEFGCACCEEDVEHDDYTRCEDCGMIYCESCRPGGYYWSSNAAWIPPLLRDPMDRAAFDYHKGILSDRLVINSCPLCENWEQPVPESIDFDSRLELVLEAECDKEFKSAVAVVQKGLKQWLLGLSTATDDRKNTWCFPGGHIHRGEAPEKAAVRECREETGVRVKAVDDAFRYGGKREVAFVHCKVKGNVNFKNNSEFVALGFFTVREMRGLKLYKNVKDLIKRVQSC